MNKIKEEEIKSLEKYYNISLLKDCIKSEEKNKRKEKRRLKKEIEYRKQQELYDTFSVDDFKEEYERLKREKLEVEQ